MQVLVFSFFLSFFPMGKTQTLECGTFSQPVINFDSLYGVGYNPSATIYDRFGNIYTSNMLKISDTLVSGTSTLPIPVQSSSCNDCTCSAGLFILYF